MKISNSITKFVEKLQSETNLNLTSDAISDDDIKLLMNYLKQQAPHIAYVEDRFVNTEDVKIPIRIYEPENIKSKKAILFIHGGGWCSGTLDMAEISLRNIANKVGCKVFSIDYRLAPNSKFPKGLEDCLAVTQWLLENTEKLDIDKNKLIVMGESAGANLATALNLKLKNEYDIQFWKQILFYPAVDARVLTNDENNNYDSMLQFQDGPLLTKSTMQQCYQLYLNNTSETLNPYVSPIQAKSLNNISDTMIYTAEYDPLRDEGEAYGQLLIENGNTVTMRRMLGLIHGFFIMPIDEMDLVIEDISSFIQ